MLIVTPDKDLGQCVEGTRVVQYDRRKREIVDRDAVIAKFGVPPESIADYLGARRRHRRRLSRAARLGREERGDGARRSSARSTPSPTAPATGDCRVCAAPRSWRSPCATSATLALLFRRIATVELDVEVGTVDDWRWTGPTPELEAMAERLGAPELWRRADRLAAAAAPGRHLTAGPTA